MNNTQLQNYIFEAVSDGIQREWTSEEKELIANDSELQNQLKEWLSNSLSDTCWHPENYKRVRDLSIDSNFSFPSDLFEDEEIHIHFSCNQVRDFVVRIYPQSRMRLFVD